MGDKSGIEWCDATWNPVAGCTKVSGGCKNCYPIKDAHRMSSNPNSKIAAKYAGTVTADGKNWTGQVNFDEHSLLLPLRWSRPRKIFVNSMSDLFHESLSDQEIDRIFAVMLVCPQHTFQVLTKRAERMRSYFAGKWYTRVFYEYRGMIEAGVFSIPKDYDKGFALGTSVGQITCGTRELRSLPNVWLGVSIEDQQTADERIPLLMQTPAVVRWISAEPLLGPIDLRRVRHPCQPFPNDTSHFVALTKKGGLAFKSGVGLDWVVVGGESGAGARPMHPQWARDIRDQCLAAGVPFLFKQWGNWYPVTRDAKFRVNAFQDPQWHIWPDEGWESTVSKNVGKKQAGRELDGRTWDQYPQTQLG